MKKIAIFRVPDIWQRRRPAEGPLSQPKVTMANGTFILYSSGKIEAALAQGYTVYVVNEFHDTEPHDQWWIELIGKENVFFTSDEHKKNLILNSAWRRLARRLRIASKINWRNLQLDVISEIYRLSGAKKANDFVA